MAPIASFHLHRYPLRWAPAAMSGVLGDRRPLAATPGLRFARPLGTGRGSSMGIGADLRRWAAFAVWDDDDSLDAFIGHSPVAARWQDRSEESYTVRLRPTAAHGKWGGRSLFGGLTDVSALDRPGPVAVLTRASVSLRHWRAFHQAVPAVDADLHAHAGALAAVGIGEWPIGLLATFSLWRSTSDVENFAYRRPAHAEALRRARAAGWFGEELFARFQPYASTGTWGGVDPLTLAATGENGS